MREFVRRASPLAWVVALSGCTEPAHSEFPTADLPPTAQPIPTSTRVSRQLDVKETIETEERHRLVAWQQIERHQDELIACLADDLERDPALKGWMGFSLRMEE